HLPGVIGHLEGYCLPPLLFNGVADAVLTRFALGNLEFIGVCDDPGACVLERPCYSVDLFADSSDLSIDWISLFLSGLSGIFVSRIELLILRGALNFFFGPSLPLFGAFQEVSVLGDEILLVALPRPLPDHFVV